MALIKVPDGGFYVDDSQVTVDYAKKSISMVGGGADGGGLSLDGGTMNADAVINGTEELQITTADTGESGTVGITPQGVTLVHNTNSAADSRIRVIENSVEIMANGTTVALNGTGVNFGGGALSNISSIGSTAAGTAIGFEEVVDMNNHKITNLADPTAAQDAITKAYADSTYATLVGVADFVTVDDIPAASTSAAGLVRQATAVPDAEGATDTTLAATVNSLLAALRAAGILASG